MAKAVTNKMSPKPEHTPSQTPKAKRPSDNAATGHLTALLPRQQFITSLVDFTSQASLATNKTSIEPTNLEKFNPFDSVFLFSAPEQTIALMAKLCIKNGARTMILTIPAELRLMIYGFAFEQREQSTRVSPFSNAWDHLAQLGPQRGGPPILRACKLFRQEGTEEYKKFYKSVFDARWKDIHRISCFVDFGGPTLVPNRDIDLLFKFPAAIHYSRWEYNVALQTATTKAEVQRLRAAKKQRAKRERRKLREGNDHEAEDIEDLMALQRSDSHVSQETWWRKPEEEAIETLDTVVEERGGHQD